ncbi:MAG: hypothetical protein KME27_21365 [Lyngbya sp. HA4199-MV5]|jgi:hypothetical protein|nr:hypothetical protein [Lyngbya sp. HA4199-MV5]
MFYTNHRGLQVGAGLVVLAIAPLFLFAIAPLHAQSIQNLDIVTIGPRFSPNPLEVQGVAGGDMPLKEVVKLPKTPTGECIGYTKTQPNQTIELTDFFESLSLVVQSSEDTALAIQGPGGVWCNDDYQGKNPGVSGQWLRGTYKIWVSSYAKNRAPAYVLRITEKRQ